MYSHRDTTISIGKPLEGEWRFLRPPGHHPFAFDFVQTDSHRKRTHCKTLFHFVFHKIPSDDYYCWGKPVISPIDGEIIRIGDGMHDHGNTSLWNTVAIWFHATFIFRPEKTDGILDIRPNAGNHLMIRSDTGYIVFLGHLKEKSICVKPGQRVKQGEQLGRIGNSGNSTAPHLHIHVVDQIEDLLKAKVLPFVFHSYQTLTSDGEWVHRENCVPQAGDFVRF